MNKTINFDEPTDFSLVLGGQLFQLLGRLHLKHFNRKQILLDLEKANRKYGR